MLRELYCTDLNYPMSAVDEVMSFMNKGDRKDGLSKISVLVDSVQQLGKFDLIG